MTHMVIFQTPEGTPGYHQTDSVEDAVRFVESLRNEQSVDEARIFRMEEVPFEFRPYYRVELGGHGEGLRVRSFDLDHSGSIDLTEAEAPADEGKEAGPEDLPVRQFEGPGDTTSSEEDPVEQVFSGGFATRRGLFGR